MPATRSSSIRADGHARRPHGHLHLRAPRMPPLFMPDIVDGTPVASPEGPPRLMINPADRLPGRPHRVRRHRHGELRRRLSSRAGSAAIHARRSPTAGTYDYDCAVHSLVMKGKVTVQEAGVGPAERCGRVRGDGPGGDAARGRGGQGGDWPMPSASDRPHLARTARRSGCLGRRRWHEPGPGDALHSGGSHDQGRRHRALDATDHRRAAHGHLPRRHGPAGGHDGRAAGRADRRS